MSTEPQPIRVALIVHAFGVGGMERCIAHIINGMDEREFEPMVICLVANGDAARWIRRPGVPIVELHKPPGNSLRAIRQLARVLREHRIDLIHTHNWGTLLEGHLACRWSSGTRHLHAVHGLELDEFRVSGIKRVIRRTAMRCMMRRCDAVVACAESVRGWISDECRLAARKLHTITNGVEAWESSDPSSRDAIRRSLGLREESFVIGSVGRMVAEKDFTAAIDALAIVASGGHDAHLVLVGDGPLRSKLEAAAAAAGVVDRTHFVGMQSNVGEWLQSFDLYLNSSRSEAMNMGIIEAMAAGLPIVATDVGDTGVLLGGDPPAGWLLPPANPPKLAEAVTELIGDRSRLIGLGESARRRYDADYTVEEMVGRYSALYSQCCHGIAPAEHAALVESTP